MSHKHCSVSDESKEMIPETRRLELQQTAERIKIIDILAEQR